MRLARGLCVCLLGLLALSFWVPQHATAARPAKLSGATRIAYIAAKDLGVYLADSDGGYAKRIGAISEESANAGEFLGASRTHVVFIRKRGIWAYEIPSGKTFRVRELAPFWGPPTVLPGRILMGASRPGMDADDGLFSIPLSGSKPAHLQPRINADLIVHTIHRISPDGRRVAAGGGITRALFVCVSSVFSPGHAGKARMFVPGVDFDWLDNRSLLVAISTDASFSEDRSGLWRVDVKTGARRRWAYDGKTEISQVHGSHDRKWFAIGIGDENVSTRLGSLSPRIDLVEARTKKRSPVPIEAPSRICGFTPDGRRLLYLQKRAEEGEVALDLFAWDRMTGRKLLIAPEVLAAVLI